MVVEQPIVLVSRFDELDRQARGAITHRSIEDSNPANARLRRRAQDIASAFTRRPTDEPTVRDERRPRRGKGEFGLHLAVDPFPERVLHSSGFIAQLIAQQFSTDEDAPGSGEDAVAAYVATAGRAESLFFGTIVPAEAIA